MAFGVVDSVWIEVTYGQTTRHTVENSSEGGERAVRPLGGGDRDGTEGGEEARQAKVAPSSLC
jgi:hypothetical protein